MHTRALALATLLLALATTALTGCGGDSDATAEPPAPAPTSSSPTTSTSPTAAPTEAPPGETAREFIERWFALEEYAQNTGDTAPYEAITKGCESCHRTTESIRKFYSAGGYVKGGGARIVRLIRVKSVPGIRVYRADLNYEPTAYKESATTATQRFTGGPVTYQVTLNAKAPWNVHEFVRIVRD